MSKFSKIVKVTAKDYYATGSEKGSTGFFISGSGAPASASDSVLTSQHGETVAVTEFQPDTVYDLGVSRVSGSSVVYLLYPDPNKII
jgi:hypothetical protein